MGKVDEPQDTIHHGVADGDKGILAAYRNTGEKLLQNIGHRIHRVKHTSKAQGAAGRSLLPGRTFLLGQLVVVIFGVALVGFKGAGILFQQSGNRFRQDHGKNGRLRGRSLFVHGKDAPQQKLV